MNPVAVRAISLTDAAAWTVFLSLLARETPFTLVTPQEQDAAAGQQQVYVRQIASLPNQALFVAVSTEQEIVGCISLVHGTLSRMRHVCSLSMGVLKAYWGSGLSHELMCHGLAWGQAHSVKRFELSVDARNARAIKFYEKHGFVREGIRRQSLQIDGEWVDELYYGRIETQPGGK